MFGLICNVPRSLWGQTALMLVVLAIVLAVLRGFTSLHYFMGAVTVCYGICNRMVRRMVGEPKASESIVIFFAPVGGTLLEKSIMIAWNDSVSHFQLSH
jgi:hypothetical protein